MHMKTLTAALALAAVSLFASATTLAHTKAEIDHSADRALTRFYALNANHRGLIGKAAGVLIFGHVTKGGVGVGGEFGEGSFGSRAIRLITTALHLPRLGSHWAWHRTEK